MAKEFNCPNCGAPIGYSERCEYCGTVLRWMPMTCIEYVPLHLNVRKAEVAVNLPYEYADRIDRRAILDHLAGKLADFIIEQKAFTLSVSEDFPTDSCIVRMRTYIGKENR